MNEQWDEALRSLRDEPLDERLADEVRAAVLGRIRRERRQRWAWVAAARGGDMAAGLSVARRATEVPALPERARLEGVTPGGQAGDLPHAEASQPKVPVVAVAKRRVEPPRRPKPAPRFAKEPMKIHMLTDDPDLVIIWLVGEEEEEGGE